MFISAIKFMSEFRSLGLATCACVVVAFSLPGCGGGGDGGGEGGEETCTVDPAQPLGSECCPSHGLDACSPGMVCAAIEGRTVAVCYAEGSQTVSEECTEDRLCAYGLCDSATGTCAGGPGDPCVPGTTTCVSEIGLTYSVCAEDPLVASTYCRSTNALGTPCGLCLQDSDCSTDGSLVCHVGRCRFIDGQAVSGTDIHCCLGDPWGGVCDTR